MLDPKHFVVIADSGRLAEFRAQYEELRAMQSMRISPFGAIHRDGELCELQRRQAAAGAEGAEVARTIHGWAMRYDSGLQDFAVLARAESFDLIIAAAKSWCHESTGRYVWIRRSELEKVEATPTWARVVWNSLTELQRERIVEGPQTLSADLGTMADVGTPSFNAAIKDLSKKSWETHPNNPALKGLIDAREGLTNAGMAVRAIGLAETRGH